MPGGRVRLRDGLVVRVRGARGVSSARSLCCAGVVAARVSPPELGNFVSACRVPLKPWRLPHSGFVQFSFRFCLLEHLLCLLGGGAQRTGNERRRKPPPSLPRPCWPAAVMSGSPFSLKRLLVCRRGPHAQRRVAPDGVVVLDPGGPAARTCALMPNSCSDRSSNSSAECHDSMTALSSAEPGRCRSGGHVGRLRSVIS
jgi:hypothetical protein